MGRKCDDFIKKSIKPRVLLFQLVRKAGFRRKKGYNISYYSIKALLLCNSYSMNPAKKCTNENIARQILGK